MRVRECGKEHTHPHHRPSLVSPSLCHGEFRERERDKRGRSVPTLSSLFLRSCRTVPGSIRGLGRGACGKAGNKGRLASSFLSCLCSVPLILFLSPSFPGLILPVTLDPSQLSPVFEALVSIVDSVRQVEPPGHFYVPRIYEDVQVTVERNEEKK